jgi:photosystem II stability/assembly factor-like uncharacterized protein
MRKHAVACLAFVVLCALTHHPVSGATLFGLVNTGELFASADNGATWAVHSTIPVTDAVAIAAGESSDELFMVTRSGLMFRSTDAGLNWSAIGAVSASDVVEMAIRSNGDIYLLSEKGSLWRSTDDGATFTPVATLTASNHVGLTLDIKGDVLYTVTRTGEVAKSTDLGVTWNVVGLVTTSDAVAIRFVEPNLYMLTGTGDVGKSTDQGTTWIMVGTISQVNMADLTTNEMGLVAATEEGLVATSGDATSWTFAGSINQLKVVAIGNDTPTTTGVRNQVPSLLGLQIRSLWPNPAGESTTLVTIGFEIAESDRVGFHVYDVAGRLVSSSAYRELVAGGAYTLQWKVGDLPSGVYFVKLVTERGLTAPAKLTLVR